MEISLTSSLTHFDEVVIKAQFKKILNQHRNMDSEQKLIFDVLKRLNEIDGLVATYMYQDCESNKKIHYLLISCNDEMMYFLTEAINKVLEKYENVSVLWNDSILFKLLDGEKMISCVSLTSLDSIDYMNFLAKELDA